ncbi:hypothetical protein OBBRIDRAFT_795679 [Obba rivulosa]|uniref:Uncharacterized protein n=1 Tax=Obba rivulosa TaxID=1052685 RepID=A0A8E2DMG8_9APHY|nr:hypothetical protein OBBRIDRAFT_795679 [Obba rivulosa]
MPPGLQPGRTTFLSLFLAVAHLSESCSERLLDGESSKISCQAVVTMASAFSDDAPPLSPYGMTVTSVMPGHMLRYTR